MELEKIKCQQNKYSHVGTILPKPTSKNGAVPQDSFFHAVVRLQIKFRKQNNEEEFLKSLNGKASRKVQAIHHGGMFPSRNVKKNRITMFRIIILTICTVAAIFSVPVSGFFAEEPQRAKNVILMIGDGMGFSSDIAGTYYRYGKKQAQRYHQFRQLAAATFSIASTDFEEDRDTGYASDYFWKGLCGSQRMNDITCTTDSAASGTALNWGHKTLDGRIGMDLRGRPVKLIAEEAAAIGKGVGILTTVTLSNATPASVMAHQFSRKQNIEISRELILDQEGLTVLIGTGHPEMRMGTADEGEKPDDDDYKYVGGSLLWRLLKNDHLDEIKMIDTKADFDALKLRKNAQKISKRILGVLPDGDSLPPLDALPENGSTELIDTYFEGKRAELMNYFPSLADLSVGTLNLLSNNENGFYLMIEGGAIDSANHERNLTRCVLEHTGFSRAIDAVIDWVETYSSWDETLLIITADHETGHLWGPNTYDDLNENGVWDSDEPDNGFQHIVNNGAGKLPGAQYAAANHSNALVPVWIHGAGENYLDLCIRGRDTTAAEFYNKDGYSFNGEYIYNCDIPRIMRAAFGIKQDKKD